MKKTNYKRLYKKYKKLNIALHNRVFDLEQEFKNLFSIQEIADIIKKNEPKLAENIKLMSNPNDFVKDKVKEITHQ